MSYIEGSECLTITLDGRGYFLDMTVCRADGTLENVFSLWRSNLRAAVRLARTIVGKHNLSESQVAWIAHGETSAELEARAASVQ